MRLSRLLVTAVVASALGASCAFAAATDLPAATPVAKPGSAAAAKRGLSASELRRELAGAMRSADGRSGAWVVDAGARAEDALFADDANERRIPASNQKLFTTAAFLDRLGPRGHLETRVYGRGELRGRVLAGDLVIVGDGDPALGTASFARANDQPVTRLSALAKKVARAGVRRIKGRVLADDTIFDRRRRSGPYLSPLSGLSFNNGYAGDGYARAPELVAAKELKRALVKRGVKVSGRVGRAELSERTLAEDPLAEVASPAAAALIEETNVPSNNFFAEMLLKRLGAAGGKQGTRKRGSNRVESFARGLGVEVQAADGSGLSRKNAVAPREVGELLVAMAKDEQSFRAFRGSLPVAGREGTVADRMRGTAAEGNCATKTGTLDGVSALSGYCDAGKRTLAFSVLMNSVNLDAARRAQDRFAAALARYRP
jgi:D-alanyl-D-alanine carboxypeptidase/D-alanyl-D-alanine-endopeptidase (penicillin-binding protein 4)